MYNFDREEYVANARKILENRFFLLTELETMINPIDEEEKRHVTTYAPILRKVFEDALRGIYPTLKELATKRDDWPTGFKNWPLAAIIHQCHSCSLYPLLFETSWREVREAPPTDEEIIATVKQRK